MLMVSAGIYVIEFYPYGQNIWLHRIDSYGVDTKYKVNNHASCCCIGIVLTNHWHMIQC